MMGASTKFLAVEVTRAQKLCVPLVRNEVIQPGVGKLLRIAKHSFLVEKDNHLIVWSTNIWDLKKVYSV